MRPTQKKVSVGVWIVREQAHFNSEAARSEHPNPVLRLLPLLRSQSDSPASFIPQRERYICMSMKLYVGNLAFATSSQELQELFAQAGTVTSASVIEDRDTGRSRGFGFVEMSSKEEGEAAIAQLNGKEMNGRALNVNEAKPRENRGGGGGRGGFGGNRGGGGGYNGNRGGGGFSGGGNREPRW